MTSCNAPVGVIMHIILTAIWDLLNLYAKKFRCPDVLTSINTMFTLVPDISPTKPVELHHMTRKQATIAVRSGLNDDEQYGCVVPPIHLSSTYNFTGFNEPRAHDYCVAATQRAMWFSVRWQNWKAVLVQYLLIPACPRFTGNDRLFETRRSAGCAARLLRR